MLWVRRTIALILIGFGFALIFLRVPSEINTVESREVLTITVERPPYTSSKARKEFSDSVLNLSYENLDDVPEVRDAMLKQWGNTCSSCVSQVVWKNFIRTRKINPQHDIVYTFRDSISRMSDFSSTNDPKDGELMCWSAAYIGAYDDHESNPIDHIKNSTLEAYPKLANELRQLVAGEIPAEVDSGVPVKEWQDFEKTELGGFVPKFEILDHLFSVFVRSVEIEIARQMPITRPVARVLGLVAGIIGFLLLAQVYGACRSGPGVSVVSPIVAFFGDAVALFASFVGALGIVDALWVHGFGAPSLLRWSATVSESSQITMVQFVSTITIVIGLPVFTFFVTTLTTQRISIDQDGITSCGTFGKTHLPWRMLRGVHVRNQRNILLSVSGDHRSRQKILELEAKDSRIVVNQPSSWTSKERILSELNAYAPENLRQLLVECEERW